MTNQLRIPLALDADIESKKLYVLKNHWVEMTCPKCGNVTENGVQTPLFCYEEKCSYFYCDKCEHEHPYPLDFKGIDDDHCMVVERAESFTGNVSHCYYLRHVSSSIE